MGKNFHSSSLIVLVVCLTLFSLSESSNRSADPPGVAWSLFVDTSNGNSADIAFSGAGEASATGVCKLYQDGYHDGPRYREQDTFSCTFLGNYNGEWKLSEYGGSYWPSTGWIGKTFKDPDYTSVKADMTFNF